MFNYEILIGKEKEEKQIVDDIIFCNNTSQCFFNFLDFLNSGIDKDKLLSVLIYNIIEQRKNFKVYAPTDLFELIISNKNTVEKHFNMNILLRKLIDIFWVSGALNLKDFYKIFDTLKNKDDEHKEVVDYIIINWFKVNRLSTSKFYKTRGNLFRYTVEFFNYNIKTYAREIKIRKRRTTSIEKKIEKIVIAKKNKHEFIPDIVYREYSNAVITKHFKFFMKEDSKGFSRFLQEKANTKDNTTTALNVMHRPIHRHMFNDFRATSTISDTLFVLVAQKDELAIGRKYSAYDVMLGLSLTNSYGSNGKNLENILVCTENKIINFEINKKEDCTEVVNKLVDSLMVEQEPRKIDIPLLVDKIISLKRNYRRVIFLSSKFLNKDISYGDMNEKTNDLYCLERLDNHRLIEYGDYQKMNIMFWNFNSYTKYQNKFSLNTLFNGRVTFIYGVTKELISRVKTGNLYPYAYKQILDNHLVRYSRNELKDVLL